jgi:hypothetical protein
MQGGAEMLKVKTVYEQVPLGVVIKKIEAYEITELLEESLREAKDDSASTRPARLSARKGAERVQSMSN